MNLEVAALIAAVFSPVFAFMWIRTLLARRRLEARLQPITDLEQEQQRVVEQTAQQNEVLERLKKDVERLTREHDELEEEAVLRTSGFYKPIYKFSSSEQFEHRLDELREQQKAMLKEKSAATCRIEWQVNGSKVEGRKQINQTLKLMLRAFNGECDAAVAKVNYKNVKAMEARIEKAADAVNGLAEVQQCSIARGYVLLKLEELRLAYEYEEKLQAERDEQKRIREQMREEEVARREMERAKLEAERDEKRCAEALDKARQEVARAQGAQQEKLNAKIAELEQRLAEAQEKERAISQAQLTKAGHVYVISNIGSFGENVFKIGMTRRLVPQDRIDELGDASVPFEFDVHAIISTPDAPALENALHRNFASRRLNRVNERKEFFHVSLEEIESAVRTHHGDAELVRVAEAAEYRKTLAMVEAERTGTPNSEAPRVSSREPRRPAMAAAVG